MRFASVAIGVALVLAVGLTGSATTAPDPAWVASIRDLEAGESVVWTDVAGEYAEPVGIVDEIVVARWSGSISSRSSESGRALLAGVDLETGRVRWSVRLDPYVGWPVIGADGTVVVDTERGATLIGLDASDGDERWAVPVWRIATLASAGDVVVAAGRRSLEGWTSSDGAMSWDTDLRVDALFPVEEGVWARVDGTDRLLLLDPATGDEVRSVRLPEGTGVVQAVEGDVAFVSGWPPALHWSDGTVAAVDLAGGSVLWRQEVVPRDCRGAQGCTTRGVHLVTDGEVVAARVMVERSEPEPCPLGCAFGRTIVVLDAATGERRWREELEEDWEGGPGLTLAGRWLTATDAHLRTYRLRDGRSIWSIPAPPSPEEVGVGKRFSSASVVSEEGRLVVGTWGGALAAYDLPAETMPASPVPVPTPTTAPAATPSATPGAEPARAGGTLSRPLAIGAIALVIAVVSAVVLMRRRGRAGPVR